MSNSDGIGGIYMPRSLLLTEEGNVGLDGKGDHYETGIKYDDKKLDWTLLDFQMLEQVIKVLQHGAEKYDRDNWKKVERDRYVKALLRHVVDYQK